MRTCPTSSLKEQLPSGEIAWVKISATGRMHTLTYGIGVFWHGQRYAHSARSAERKALKIMAALRRRDMRRGPRQSLRVPRPAVGWPTLR